MKSPCPSARPPAGEPEACKQGKELENRPDQTLMVPARYPLPPPPSAQSSAVSACPVAGSSKHRRSALSSAPGAPAGVRLEGERVVRVEHRTRERGHVHTGGRAVADAHAPCWCQVGRRARRSVTCHARAVMRCECASPWAAWRFPAQSPLLHGKAELELSQCNFMRKPIPVTVLCHKTTRLPEHKANLQNE